MSGFQLKDGGFYRTRNGEKAEVLSYSLTRDCWLGFRLNGTVVAWHSDGRLVDRMAHESALSGDLIAPWTEPKRGAVWVNVFQRQSGKIGFAGYFASRAEADANAALARVSVRIACVSVNWTEGEGL